MLLDRDGVLIPEEGYAYTPERISLLPGVIEGLRAVKDEFVFFVVSNQSGTARGFTTATELEACNARLTELLAQQGITLTDIVYCPHLPEDECVCRKPATGMWEMLRIRHALMADAHVMVGNRACDMVFGRNIGAKVLLVTGTEHVEDVDGKMLSLRELPALLRDAS